MDEAKDAVDLILDRLAGEAGGDLAPQDAEEVSPVLAMSDAADPDSAHSRAANASILPQQTR